MNCNQSQQADMEFVDIPGASMRVSRVALILRETIRDPVGPEFMAPPDRLAA